MTEQSHVRVQTFLQEFFNDEELTTLCLKYFLPVYKNFSRGMTKNEKENQLIAYCWQNRCFDKLLRALEREKSQLFHKHFPDKPIFVYPDLKPKSIFNRRSQHLWIMLAVGGTVVVFLLTSFLWSKFRAGFEAIPTGESQLNSMNETDTSEDLSPLTPIASTSGVTVVPSVTITNLPGVLPSPSLTLTNEPSPTDTLIPSSTPTNSPTSTPPIQLEIAIRDWLRSGPANGYAKVGDGPLEVGEMVALVAELPDGEWLLISLEDGRIGWIVDNMVEIPLEKIIPTAVTRPPTLTPTKTPAATPTLPVEQQNEPPGNNPPPIPPTDTPIKPTTEPPSG